MKINIGNDLYLKGRIGWKGLSKDEYLEKSNYRIINGYSLKDGFIDWEIAGYISEARYEESPEIKLEINDILISKDGTIGKVGIVRELELPTTVASGIFVLRNIIEDRLDTEYLFQYLKSSNFKNFINRVKASGSTIIHLYQRDLIKLEIDVPNLKEQKLISSLLKNLDTKIELNNKINIELEAMIKTLYDYWFVQFDFPDANGNPYKTSVGKMVWNEELKREIPKGWDVKKLNESIDLILDHRGKTPLKLGSDWTNDKDGIIALSAKIVKDGKLVNLDQANKVSQELYDKWMPIKLINGDILMTSEAPAGEFYFIQGKTNYCMSQRLFGIRANQSIVLPSYLYYELSKGHGYSQIIGSLSGSTVFGIRQEVLRKILVVVPNLEIQKQFNKIVLPQLEQIKLMDEQNQELSSLRDWLLPMLMNGEVSVGEVSKDYVVKDEVLGMVAEPAPLFENDLKIDDLNASIAAIYYIENKKNGYAHAKTGFHKTLFFAKTAMKQSILKNIQFQRYFHGTFSKQVANAIENNPFLTTERISRKLEIFKLKDEKNLELKEWMDKKENKSFVKSIEQLVDLYQDPIISNDIDKMELMNTVYKIILDINSTDFNKIWKEMKGWSINKEGALFKSDKFTLQDTKDMIKFIVRIGWYN